MDVHIIDVGYGEDPPFPPPEPANVMESTKPHVGLFN